MTKIYAPIDNKNLMEGPFEDDVFRDFYWAPDHGTGSKRRHLVGMVKTENCDAIVDVRWCWGEHQIDIQVIGMQPAEDIDEVRREVFAHYEQTFRAWQCDDNPGLVVETKQVLGILTVSFYFECEDEPDESNGDPAQEVYAAYSENMRNAVAYINEQLEPEDKAIICATVDKNFKQRMNPSYGIDDGKIIDLLEEYGDDHDLGEGWWEDECELDDIVLLIQFEN